MQDPLATSAEIEQRRQALLLELDVLDTLPEAAYDDVVSIAAAICGAPIALISLLDPERQWFKARVGLEAPETPRSIAFCHHAVNEPNDLMVVRDTLNDSRFAGNPLVLGEPGIRFYAGAPLMFEEGTAIGTLCVIDRVPRDLTDVQRAALTALSRQVVALLQLRRRNTELDETRKRLLLTQQELERACARLAQDAATDALTGLVNRRALDATLVDYARGEFGRDGDIAVAMLDIDHFKQINDTLGHAAGDEVLRTLGKIVRQSLRGIDLACRYGGEEFLLLMHDTTLAAARTVLERIRLRISSLSGLAPFTVSIGLVAGRIERDPVATLIVRADEALYRAKHQGRNMVMVAEDC